MKIGGVEVSKPCEEILVLPRPMLDDDVVIRATAVLSMEEFESLCPKPTPPQKLVRGGFEADVEAPAYKQELEKWGAKRIDWMCLKSLEPSEIEWETVDMDKPGTWKNWKDELAGAGFSSTEVNRIVACVLQANSLDESKLTQARESFLRGQGAAQEKPSGPRTEPTNTQSGQPAESSE